MGLGVRRLNELPVDTATSLFGLLRLSEPSSKFGSNLESKNQKGEQPSSCLGRV